MIQVYEIKSRGLFDWQANKAFKISRSQIEAFVECPRCFWCNHRAGLRRPSGPPFTINSLVDTNLKAEFDLLRKRQQPHPIMLDYGLNAVPFQHPDIDIWRENFKGIQHLHGPTNLLIAGAVDDVWQCRDSGRLIVVDYKATSKNGEVNLDADWQMGYKRQMEVYIWLLRQLGFQVDERGFFLYANGQKAPAFNNQLSFTTVLLPYSGGTDWIEPVLADLKQCLLSDQLPAAPPDCEYCGYIAAVNSSLRQIERIEEAA